MRERQRLIKEKTAVDREIRDMRTRLLVATQGGGRMDESEYQALRHGQSLRQQRSQQLQAQIAEVNLNIAGHRQVIDMLLDVVRETIPGETFQQMLAEAHRRVLGA